MSLGKPFFSQKKLFKSRYYYLRSDRLVVTGHRFFGRFQMDIPLEVIRESSFSATSYSSPLLWFTVILVVLTAFSGLTEFTFAPVPTGNGTVVLYGVGAILSFILLLLSYDQYAGLHCEGNYEVVFFQSLPSDQELQQAMDRILQARHVHLQAEMGQYVGLDILEELFKIKSLYDQQLVSHDEFARLTLRLLDQDWRWSGPPPEQH